MPLALPWKSCKKILNMRFFLFFPLFLLLLPLLWFSYWYSRENGIILYPGNVYKTNIMIDAFQAGHKKKIPVRELYDHDWYKVCTMIPYASASDVVGDGAPIHKPIQPFDYKLRENYWGLLFIEKEKIDFFEIFSGDVVNAHGDSRCYARDKAVLALQDNKDGIFHVILKGEE